MEKVFITLIISHCSYCYQVNVALHFLNDTDGVESQELEVRSFYQNQKLMVSLRSDIVSFWFWGYRGYLRIELQAPVVESTRKSILGHNRVWGVNQWVNGWIEYPVRIFWYQVYQARLQECLLNRFVIQQAFSKPCLVNLV